MTDGPDRRPSIRDVAARAGVSVATVSNVLRRTKAATPDVEQRVREAARVLGYAADRAASVLRSGRNRVVAVFIPSLDNPFFTALVASLERNAREADYDIIIASAGDDAAAERRHFGALLAWRPAGVLMLPRTDEFACRDLLARAGLPYVVIDRPANDAEADLISSDNRGAGAQAVHHLASLGHERLLVAASSLALINIRERWDGVSNVAAGLGLPTPQLLEVGQSFETAVDALSVWLQANTPPTAILALTNFSTLAMLACLREHGLDVPGDVSVVGFDDYAWMRAVSPPITAVRQPVERLGEAAWTCLVERIEGGAQPPRDIRLSCTLEVRQSTRQLDNGRTP